MAISTRSLTASPGLVTRSILIVLLASIAFLTFVRESDACTVWLPESALEELERSSYVFSGKVVSVHPVPNDRFYEFIVDTVWKGPLHGTAYIRENELGELSASCEGGYRPFIVGKDYLVYDDNNVAKRTSLLVNASKDIAELGEGKRPVAGSMAPVPSALLKARAAIAESRVRDEQATRTWTLLIVWAAVLLVVIVICVLLWNHAVSRQ